MTINGATLINGNLEVSAPAGVYLDSIDVSMDGPRNHAAVRLTSLTIFSQDEHQSLGLDFSFSGTDSDGDTVGGDFSITLQNSTQLDGGSGDDAIGGGLGTERLHGGAGNDILTGGIGADIFAWEFGDQGTVTHPAIDHITDFSMADTNAGGDALDLADLLQGATHDNIGSYLGFEKSGADTIVHVSSTGDIGSGADQLIVLQNVDLTTLGDDHAIINDLMNRGKLIIE